MIKGEIEEIGEGVREVQQKMKEFSLDSNVPAVYLLGNTGSGKSTLTNYILGANLKVKKKGMKW